jgi:rod shape determining protein RodA
MALTHNLKVQYTQESVVNTLWQRIHIDIPLLLSVMSLLIAGLIILYSASNQDLRVVEHQAFHMGLGLIIMMLFAQVPAATYQRWALILYSVGVILLIAVLIVGHIGKGASRWIHIGFINFQPSEIMKLALPMFLAWHFHKMHLPLTVKSILFSGFAILIPAVLTAKEPDLGTGILLAFAGFSVLLLAGLSWRIITTISLFLGSLAPALWYFMHDYQRQRVLIFLNPERDPLGSGYHIIQSKIAIGSGGLFGKGWLSGTQSHLHFLPEHSTDFIFAVCGEEFGFIGSVILITLFMMVVIRGIYIAMNAQDTFSRLLAGSLALTFFASFFINMGMVTGILPVVGLPLPLISYGGSSMMTFMASFGILMSIQTHRKLLTT